MWRRLATFGVMVAAAIASPSAPLAAAGGPPGSGAPSRELLDRYCVTCHNERLQVAELRLDQVDLTRSGEYAPVREKVVHKLRSGQMPPEGRPRPDSATIDAFATSLETALDGAAAARPNRPGRVGIFRLRLLRVGILGRLAVA